ncbi:hypothetical protein NQZ68_009973, partial [Dissostichus eleginoides]
NSLQTSGLLMEEEEDDSFLSAPIPQSPVRLPFRCSLWSEPGLIPVQLRQDLRPICHHDDRCVGDWLQICGCTHNPQVGNTAQDKPRLYALKGASIFYEVVPTGSQNCTGNTHREPS